MSGWHGIFTSLNLPDVIAGWHGAFSIGALLLLYVIALVAAGHILIVKRDPRASLGWLAVCLGFPGIGVLFYILFGINRIRTRAKDWQVQDKWGLAKRREQLQKIPLKITEEQGIDHEAFTALVNVSNSVTRRPLISGCHLQSYHNGEETYPAMMEAIEGARHSVYLSTYIYDNNTIGKSLADALIRAKSRGVEVKVILDGFGQVYTFPSAYAMLRKKGVDVVLFLPLSLSKRSVHFNLRNHRKILTVDGKIGFTGGMNIGDRHYVTNVKKRKRVVDCHFRVEGGVVAQMEDTFFEDWHFVTASKPAKRKHAEDSCPGHALCRGVSAGPNEDFEKLRWIVNGAFASARKRIRLMTPYFIPDASMIAAIMTARMKGVEIEIILPYVNNLPYVGWATQAYLEEFLSCDVKIYYRPSPFAHSKILVVDDFFSLIGSANMDPRSLRLNFEFNLEVYDKKFAAEMTRHFDEVREHSTRITLKKIQKRPIPVKLRDGFCKLFSPYL
jgi:cardiolipin synthase